MVNVRICPHCRDAPAAWAMRVVRPEEDYVVERCSWCMVAGWATIQQGPKPNPALYRTSLRVWPLHTVVRSAS